MAKADNVASNPLKEEMVKIKIPKTPQLREPVFVSRNGKGMYIQRGVEVEVPKGIAEIIENSDRQADIVYDLITEAENEAKAKENQLI
jgi:hypothetical protein